MRFAMKLGQIAIAAFVAVLMLLANVTPAEAQNRRPQTRVGVGFSIGRQTPSGYIGGSLSLEFGRGPGFGLGYGGGYGYGSPYYGGGYSPYLGGYAGRGNGALPDGTLGWVDRNGNVVVGSPGFVGGDSGIYAAPSVFRDTPPQPRPTPARSQSDSHDYNTCRLADCEQCLEALRKRARDEQYKRGNGTARPATKPAPAKKPAAEEEKLVPAPEEQKKDDLVPATPTPGANPEEM